MEATYSRVIPEDKLDGRRLGRHVQHDPRSRDYPAEATTLKSVRHQAVGLPLNQGDIGSCTANALCGALNLQPYDYKHGPFTEQGAIRLYERETADEGDPYPPNDPGGTGLAVCRAARELGWITSYRHAFGLDHALRALVLRPVIFGVNWYDGFDSPDANGLVQISGSVRGGHEIAADEIDVERQLVGFWNSWGEGWGLGGRFYMAFETVGRLLGEQGDATVPHV